MAYDYYMIPRKDHLLTRFVDIVVGEPTAPMKDPAPQADEQTRNQNVEDATAPKVKSEKECMYRRASGYVAFPGHRLIGLVLI